MFLRKIFCSKESFSLYSRWAVIVLTGLVLTGCEAGFGRSGNAELSRLTLRNATLEPAFRSEERDYEARVASTDEIVTVIFNATPESEEATMTLNGVALPSDTDVSRTLVPGRNTFNIEVTAENEFTLTYTVVVTLIQQTSNDAFLNALSLENVPLDFDRDTLDYTANVNFFVNSTQVLTTQSDSLANANLTVGEGTAVVLPDMQPSNTIALPGGETSDINVTVTSTDTSTTRAYTVAVDRALDSMLMPTPLPKADEPETGDRFGDVLSIDGDTLAIGAPGNDLTESSGENAGGVYIYTRTAGDWSEFQLIASSSQIEAGDLFGSSIALNGDVMAIGAPGANGGNGEVHLYTRSAAGQWEFDETLTPAEGSTGAEFGFSISMSDEYLLIGAPGANSAQGRVYVLIPDSATWDTEQVLQSTGGAGGDRFGHVVQLNVDQTEAEFAASAPMNAGTGAVYVFQRVDNDNNNPWAQTGEVIPDLLESGDNFGWSMAIQRGRLVVGAPGDDSIEVGVSNEAATDNDASDSGAAYIFTRTEQGQSWNENTFTFFKASQSSSGMAFGSTVALSANMLAVGAPMEDGASEGITTTDDNLGEDNSGAVYVFENTAAEWAFRLYIKATNTDEEDAFGNGLTFEGEDLLIGAPNEDTGQPESGAVYFIR